MVALAAGLALVLVAALVGTIVARGVPESVHATLDAAPTDAQVRGIADAVADEAASEAGRRAGAPVASARNTLDPLVRASGLAFPPWAPMGPAPVLTLDSAGCSRRNMRSLADRIAADAAASDAVARAAFRWLTCTPPDAYESIFVESPPAGARVPADVPWGDYLATTPVGHPRGPAPMWCFDTTGDTGHAQCFAALEACRGRRDELVALLPDATECREIEALWCYPTRGTERRCAIERADCESRRARYGEPRGRCTARYPR